MRKKDICIGDSYGGGHASYPQQITVVQEVNDSGPIPLEYLEQMGIMSFNCVNDASKDTKYVVEVQEYDFRRTDPEGRKFRAIVTSRSIIKPWSEFKAEAKKHAAKVVRQHRKEREAREKHEAVCLKSANALAAWLKRKGLATDEDLTHYTMKSWQTKYNSWGVYLRWEWLLAVMEDIKPKPKKKKRARVVKVT